MDDRSGSDIDVGTLSHLVNAAREGDAAARSEVCRQVQGTLDHLANKHLDPNLRRKINPSDIVQATLTRVVQNFDDFRGATSAEFYGWLNTILKNEVHSTRRDLHRQRRDIRRESNSTDGSEIPERRPETPSRQLLNNETLAQFHAVISRLPPDYAQVIELRSIQELPFDEIAKKMNRSVNAVSKLWGRALVNLQQELSKLDDSFLI